MGRRPAQGFILVMVLAMLVVLSLLAGTIAGATIRLRDQAQGRQRQLQDAMDSASTQATLTYLLVSQPMTVGGLTVDQRIAGARAKAEQAGMSFDFDFVLIGNEIALDSTVFSGLGDIRFAIQDDSGLFGINLQPAEALDRLLRQSGAAPALPATVLIDRMMDYQDPDDLYRLDSMEKAGYAKLGLPPPPNRTMTTPMELLRIPGWAQALSHLSSGQINDTVSVDYSAMINVNTAPASVLATIAGIDKEIATRVVMRRKVQPFLTEATFSEFTGVALSYDASLRMYPSTSGTLKLWSSRGGQVQLVHWTLTPTKDGGRPWREDYEIIQPQDKPDAGTALPVRSRLFAKPVAAQP